jgi:primosomal protein N' (replication factor Y)
VLDRFGAPGGRILVGTQMIAKGHHFPDVTLVGVIDADLTLRFPDFRAEERTFAMLVQVAGRSGRGPRGGRVLVQTLAPEARPIAMAAAGEHERFYADEIGRRGELRYPPAATLVSLETSAVEPRVAADGAQLVARRLKGVLVHGEQLLGPGPLSRERSRYVARLLVKTDDPTVTLRALAGSLDDCRRGLGRTVRLLVDVEPQWM